MCGARASPGAPAGHTHPLWAILILLLVGWGPFPAVGQQISTASPFLPVDHWSHTALARLHGAGLLPEGFDPGTRSVSRLEALRRFQEAAGTAGEQAPAWTPLTEGYRDRLREEFPGTASLADAGATGVRGDAGLTGGMEIRRNGVLARHQAGVDSDSRTVLLEDRSRPTGRLDVGLSTPPGAVSAAFVGSTGLTGADLRASEVYGIVQVRTLGLWAGRRELRYGASDGGSVVLGGGVPFDGAGLFLADNVRLPGFLRHLGSLRAEGSVSRVDRTGQVESPWFMSLRTALAPHPRAMIGLNRGVFFAGEGDLVPSATADRVLKVVVGIDTADEGRMNFENHTAGLDFWVAPPLGALPLVLYGEWAVQDLQAQRTEMPAFLFGARLEGVPGTPWLRLGIERTSFRQPFANRRPWYDHRVFGTWTDGGRLLGHPLGGVGREFRVYGNADLMDAHLRLDGRLHTRRRTRDNLLAPEREGSSRGMEGVLRWRLSPAVELEAGAEIERGSEWSTGGGFLGARYRF